MNRSTGKLARTDVTLTGRPTPGPEPRQDRDAIRWPGLKGSLAQIPLRVGSHRLRPSQVRIQSTYPGFVSQTATDPAEQASEAYSTFNLDAGKPLDPAVRPLMEGSFGQDFSGVRLHTGAAAHRAADALDAIAYTVGQDIVFGRNSYDPATARGRYVLAHELSHTVQQRNAAAGPVTEPEQRPFAEQEAGRAAWSVLAGRPAVVRGRINSRSPQRLALMPAEFDEADIANPIDVRKSPDYVDNGIDDVRLLPEDGGIASVLHPHFIGITVKYVDGSVLVVPIEQLQAPREPGMTQIIRYRRHARSGKFFPLIWRGTPEQIITGYDPSKGTTAFNRDVTPNIMALYDRAIVRGALETGKLGDYSLITFPDLPAPKLRRSARRKVLHNSTGKDERLLRMPGNPGHGNGPSF